MSTNIKFILTGLVGLLIGIGGTFAALQERNGDDDGHRMADGSMMHGSMNMEGEMDGMMSALSGKTGDEFDKTFLAQMTVHHEGAVAMAKAALINAKHDEIKSMANAIISTQTTEISQMKSWQSTWYGN